MSCFLAPSEASLFSMQQLQVGGLAHPILIATSSLCASFLLVQAEVVRGDVRLQQLAAAALTNNGVQAL